MESQALDLELVTRFQMFQVLRLRLGPFELIVVDPPRIKGTVFLQPNFEH